tara:strand:+ start:14 stop:535 length:522 start_codon:yes stop_codon:yes gene_type:complete
MLWFLDVFFVLFILFQGYRGYYHGFIEELGRLAGFILAILVSISYTAKFAVLLNQIYIFDNWITFSFSFLFIITLLLVRFLTKMFHFAFLSHENQLMNQVTGFVFGTTKGFIIIIVFIWFIALLPVKKWTNFIEESSSLAKIGNEFRISIVSFFNWEDPISLGEAYIKQVTQP